MNYLDHTKKEIQEAATVEAMLIVEEGHDEVLIRYLLAKAKIEYYTSLSNGLHECAMEEFDTYGEKEVDYRGRKISKFEAGVKYDFSKCGHVEMDSLERVKNDVEARLKAFKNQIKYIDKPQTMVNEDGEVFEVKPPTKTSTTKLKLQY